MDAKQMEQFRIELKANLEAIADGTARSDFTIDDAIDAAMSDSEFAGLDALFDLEAELRKLDLVQIGHFFLSWIGEANHSSWDPYEREDLVKFNFVLEDILQNLKFTPIEDLRGGFTFDGIIGWDEQGRRYEIGK